MVYRVVIGGMIMLLVGGGIWCIALVKQPTVCENTSVTQTSWRVFYIDSYEPNYVHSALVCGTARHILEKEGVALDVVYMDGKRQPPKGMMEVRARNIYATIKQSNPDLIIAADDPACQYVVVPYLKEGPWPVVCVGIDYDASAYGLPCSNVTGQIEVGHAHKAIEVLRPYADGDRVGILLPDVLTCRKTLPFYMNLPNIQWERVDLVKTFALWKQAFKEMQDSVDILIIPGTAGIQGWNPVEAQYFVDQHTRIPTGGAPPQSVSLVVVSYVDNPLEFGEYAGHTALEILRGRDPSSIPMSESQRTRIYINMNLAKKLGIRFPMSLIERANFVAEALQ